MTKATLSLDFQKNGFLAVCCADHLGSELKLKSGSAPTLRQNALGVQVQVVKLGLPGRLGCVNKLQVEPRRSRVRSESSQRRGGQGGPGPRDSESDETRAPGHQSLAIPSLMAGL